MFKYLILTVLFLTVSQGLQIDSDFGLVRVDFAGGRDTAYRVVEAYDSYYLVGPVATGTTDFGLARINRCGNLVFKVSRDMGGQGSRTDVATAAVIHEGYILIGGTTQNATTGNDLLFSFARFDKNGQIDSSFGQNGIVLVDVDPNGVNDEVFDMAIDPNNRIIATGFSNPGQVVGNGPAFNFGTLALLNNGQIDTSFGTNGRLITSFGPETDDRARAVLITRQNRILLGGRTRSPPSPNFNASLAQYTFSGQPDTSFGNHRHDDDNVAINPGQVAVNLGVNSELMVLMGLRNNKFLAAGNADNTFVLARFHQDGRLDPSFDPVYVGFEENTVNTLQGAFTDQDERNIFLVGNSRLNNTINRPVLVHLNKQGTVISKQIFQFPELKSGLLRSGLVDSKGNIVVVGEGVALNSNTADMIAFRLTL
jgi:uncharacterized delta-60 repeat protein